MSKRFHSFYSHALGRDMGMYIHGHAGKPCVVFPSQDGSYDNFEGFGMLEPCTPYLRDGKLRLYCVDGIDKETWSNKGGNPRHRMERHEAWFRYLTDELTPFIYQDTGWQGRLMTTGCSMGATHAANLLFRRPDLYDTVIGLSGAYDAAWLMDGYTDDLVHLNSPVSSVSAMPYDHPYIDMLNSCTIILCAGRGAWEEQMLHSMGLLQRAMNEKGINAWFDYWGEDVNHDWPWWRIQLAYFLSKVMG